jgi:hypothetical protein
VRQDIAGTQQIEDLGHQGAGLHTADVHHNTRLPSAHLTVYLQCGARGVIRDSWGSDAKRFLGSVVPSGQLEPIAEGRTGEMARARAIAPTEPIPTGIANGGYGA